ncbi:universal stress protein [Kitasatospora sp. NPDC127059]|uniref:universal stress protein n=1 Tax=unclassified Kitasatospora TaxID=2633591 RepID=UPI0036498F48
MTGPVVVGFDGSPESLAASEWAVREARRRELRLEILQSWPWPRRDVVGSDETYRLALSRLAEREAALRALAPEVPVSSSTVSTEPAEALEAAARSAGVLVLGSRGLGTIHGFLVGSVSQEVLGRADCPVVLVRAGGGGHDGPVLVGLDLARPADEVLAYAFGAAAVRSTPLRVLHVWAPPAGSEYTSFDAVRSTEKDPSAEERALLAEVLEPWRARYPGVEARAELVRGGAAAAVVEAAATARLLVLGRRMRRGPLGARLGPVAHAAIHHVGCPVAIVPHS